MATIRAGSARRDSLGRPVAVPSYRLTLPRRLPQWRPVEHMYAQVGGME